jgi:hypothetical protein
VAPFFLFGGFTMTGLEAMVQDIYNIFSVMIFLFITSKVLPYGSFINKLTKTFLYIMSAVGLLMVSHTIKHILSLL